MDEIHHCPQCGAALPPDAPEGACPKCVLALGLGQASGHGSAGSVPDAEGVPPTSPYRPDSRFVPPEPAELAKHFPQLEILELLGQGGMGAVYKARQPRLNRLVALKILPAEVAGDPAFSERFAREAQALAQLNHPRIVAVYDFGEAGGLYYFLMEFVDGVDLRRMLRNGQLGPREALAIVPQICEALQFAHDEGIVHRDIKPENILVDKKGRVKIADFGLAKLLGRPPASFNLTGSQQVMGTPHYMAPEQMERPLTVDHRADIYSLGVVFYEMLTGELPLGRFAPPSQKVQIDVRLDEIVLRSLEKEPERRYQHASDVKTDVETIGRSGQVAPETFPARTMPRDFTDVVLAFALTPIVVGVFLGLPFLAVYFVSSGMGLNDPRSAGMGAVAGLAVLLIGFLILGSGSVQSVVVDRGGLTIRRYIGPSRFLPWSTVVRIEPISRRDVFWQVWLWPGLPPRGSIIGMSALHYYRIDCHGDCWYFAPKDPGAFLAVAARWLEAGKVPAAPLAAANANSRTRRWPLVLGFCCLVALAMFLFLLRRDDTGPESLWDMAPDGPTITAEFAECLKLDPNQAELVNTALRKFYREFRAAEEANTSRPINKSGTKDDARQITIIAPIGDAVKKLKGEFWAEMARVLTRSELKAKGWLHTLEYDVFRAFPGFQAVSSRHPAWPYQPGYTNQFPYQDFRIEIWRAGQLYHWKVRTRRMGPGEGPGGPPPGVPGPPRVPGPPGVPIGPPQKGVVEDTESSGRQLPDEYRRFWKEPATDEARMEGVWDFVSLVIDGKAKDPPELKGWKVTYVKGESRAHYGGRFEDEKGPWKLDPTKNPKTIDGGPSTEGPDKGQVLLGIYEFDGDALKICWAPVGSRVRPTEFTSAPGSGRNLVVMKRAQPGSEKSAPQQTKTEVYVELDTLDAKQSAPPQGEPFPPPTHVAFSSDGKSLIALVGLYKHSWELEPRKDLGRKKLGDFIFKAKSGTLAADGKTLTLVRFGGEVELWAIDEAVRRARVKTDALVAAFPPSGDVAVATQEGFFKRLCVNTSATHFSEEVPAAIRAIAFAADTKLVAFGRVDGVVQVRDGRTGASKAQFSQASSVACVAMDRDGKRVAAGFADGAVLVWDVASQKQQTRLGPHPGVTSLAFAPDGRLIATGSTDGTVKLWAPAQSKRDK